MVQASEEVIRYFQQAGSIRHIPKKEIIYLQGDLSCNIYLISKGRVRMFFTGDNGKEVTYQIIGERQIFGESSFLGHAARPATICAVTDVTIISCQIQCLLSYLDKSKELNHTLLTLLTDNYHFLCGQVRRLSVYNRFQRIARLVKLGRKKIQILDREGLKQIIKEAYF